MRDFLDAKSTPVPGPGCLIWLGGLDKDGYGQCSYRNRNMRAHRVSYLLHKGPLLQGKVIMHVCDTPACINPDHLEQVDQIVNDRDRDAKGRHWAQKGDDHYMRRNPLLRSGEKCPSSKLTADQVLKIRDLFASGISQPVIASKFGISRPAVSAIVVRRNWKHL
jgi:hypothetical protein